MSQRTDSRLNQLIHAGQQHLLRDGLKGLEKESLRLTSDGIIAHTPHPIGVGSALTHPYITTDYSEALIELITPPYADPAETLRFLKDLHTFVYRNVGDEILLATSMPCGVAGDESIPIAEYGTSNIGRMKHIYRRGLAYRYGRMMQAIAGVHFNYSVNEALWPVLRELEGGGESLSGFISENYFGIVRNVHRYGWLTIYLFGASPAFGKSFFAGREYLASRFSEFDARTLFRPYATSLRMSDIGYKNDSQARLEISFNSLDDYVASLGGAIATPYPLYREIGVKVDGDYRQLNSNILQIENEYYSVVRPKQIAESGEKPTLALKRRGVRYLELRSLDLGCFGSAGVSLEQLRFLEIFLLFCLLEPSPPIASAEKAEAGQNGLAVACCGRMPGFRLLRSGREVPLKDWAEEILDAMRGIAEILDAGDRSRPYTGILEQQTALFSDPALTPSARMLAEMRANRESFDEYALRISSEHARALRDRFLSAERSEFLRRLTEESLEEQMRIEADDKLPFDEFLQRYFAQA
ncbi:glutamate--cysteine ligase [Methylocaldum marinum]|uniref:Glutamate--cysteine ligase n=1 Tax=Methylocaldum marinum TaxID=1432792 RepID=A0A250KRI9_9GAMM|nr:glutamate--cysteine ligase [Methylocaldum marinum]BBA34164.1 glutamate--cysteine ligase [Methylocaldum marinum]